MRGTTTKTPERVAEAVRLREQGLTFREVGERFGVHYRTIQEWVHDPDGSLLRARKDSYASRCIDCGAPTSGWRGRRAEPRCRSCATTRGIAQTHAQRDHVIAFPHVAACHCARPMPVRDEDGELSCLKCGIAVAPEMVAA